MTHEEAAICLARLRTGFPASKYDSETLGAWLDHLEHVDANDFANAVYQAIQEDEFPPTLARLLDFAAYHERRRLAEQRRALPAAPIPERVSTRAHVVAELRRIRKLCSLPLGHPEREEILDECDRLVPAELSTHGQPVAGETQVPSVLGIGEE